jgi:hypothetical protein
MLYWASTLKGFETELKAQMADLWHRPGGKPYWVMMGEGCCAAASACWASYMA